MLELYHHGSSACATKVRLTLDEKGVPWESRYIDILKSEQFTAEYAELNPKCVVPTLVHDGHVVRESTVICEYIDEVFDGPSLVPDDPRMRAEMRLWTKMVDEDLHPATQVVTFAASHRVGALTKTKEEFDFYINSIPDPVRRARKRSAIVDGWKSPEATNALLTFNKAIKWMEDSLGKWRWLAGDGYSLADIAMTIYLNRLQHPLHVAHVGGQISEGVRILGDGIGAARVSARHLRLAARRARKRDAHQRRPVLARSRGAAGRTGAREGRLNRRDDLVRAVYPLVIPRFMRGIRISNS